MIVACVFDQTQTLHVPQMLIQKLNSQVQACFLTPCQCWNLMQSRELGIAERLSGGVSLSLTLCPATLACA